MALLKRDAHHKDSLIKSMFHNGRECRGGDEMGFLMLTTLDP